MWLTLLETSKGNGLLVPRLSCSVSKTERWTLLTHWPPPGPLHKGDTCFRADHTGATRHKDVLSVSSADPPVTHSSQGRRCEICENVNGQALSLGRSFRPWFLGDHQSTYLSLMSFWVLWYCGPVSLIQKNSEDPASQHFNDISDMGPQNKATKRRWSLTIPLNKQHHVTRPSSWASADTPQENESREDSPEQKVAWTKKIDPGWSIGSPPKKPWIWSKAMESPNANS